MRAFAPLVAAIADLHNKDIIHRDIKPANVFIAADGRLVLGDFGIVFWTDPQQKRLTETYERVGSRDWMAPWANRGARLKEVKPSFDVFPLGKLLWAMVSGQHELPYWYWKDPEHNLEELFPGAPGMDWINSRILGRTVVERESSALSRLWHWALRGVPRRWTTSYGDRLDGKSKAHQSGGVSVS